MTLSTKQLDELEALAKTRHEWIVGIITHRNGQGFGFSASGPPHSYDEKPTSEDRTAAYKKAQGDRDFLLAIGEHIQSLIATARSALVMREALQFYAAQGSWHKPIAGNSAVVIDLHDCYRDEGEEWMTGGKSARRALAAADEIVKGSGG